MDSVAVIFVLPNEFDDETEAGEVMLQAFEACKQNKVNSSWVKEKDLNIAELKKTDFIVFENFDGRDFGNIIKQKSAILGPWCILICLMEGKKIPNFQWPIYNVAMYNCVITTSNLPKKSKMAICEKVQKMGGYYSDTLTENITHLISDSVKTVKYSKAIEMNIKIMTSTWIDTVWSASQKSNVHCDDEQFKQFKCLPFHKLVISSTGITNTNVREEIKRLITVNGGEYTGKLNLSNTDFLICEGANGCISEKYREARKTGTIHCVTLQWLYDSVVKGYCLQHELYTVQKGTSTPQKDNHINPNFSTMSAINSSKFEKTSVDDTIQLSNDKVLSNGIKRKAFSEYHSLIEQIDIKRAKRSGQFLDGCSVYLVGFNGDHREKLCKIINASGATRCDDMSDRVTHVIVGDTECHELKTISSKGYCCSVVNLHWLLDSIERRRPCNEETYLVNTESDHSKFRSPLGKKALNLLRTSRVITEVDLTLSQNEEEKIQDNASAAAERDIMQQYLVSSGVTEEDTLVNLLKNANYDSKQLGIEESQDRASAGPSSSLDADSTLTSQDQSQPLRIFIGLSFLITGFEEEQEAELRDTIESAFGKITKDINKCKFVIAPSIIFEPLIYEHVMTVSDIWLFDSLNEQQLVEIQYYHRPLLIKNPSVLKNCVVTISGYSGYERNFLAVVILHLGATSQEQFCRITSEERNVLGSTHLVTAEASGKKYAASLKWRLPAVDKEWLIGCAKTGKRLPENEFLVSEKTTQDGHIFSNDSSKNSNKENISDKSKNNENSKNSASSDSSKSIPNVSQQGNVENAGTDPETTGTIDVGASSSRKSYDKNENDESISNTSTNNAVIGEYNTPKSHKTDNSFTFPAPKTSYVGQRDTKFKTPDRRVPDEYCSQVTPVDKIMKEVRMTNLLGTPESPQLAKAPWDVDTPETPYGAYIDPNPSRSLKKEMLRFLNQFPDRIPPPRRKLSTPLSELKRRLWAKIGSSQSQTQSQTETQVEDDSDERSQGNNYDTQGESSTQNALVNTRLQQLEEMMVAASGSANKSRRQSRPTVPVPEYVSEARDSQPCTVQWDFGKDTQEEPSPSSKVFMISGVNNMDTRLKMVAQLEKLGATVSESSSYDPDSTHLLCPKPARNEKTLSCMASGKWILHTNYVDACVKAEKFLDEEEYEFGNSHSIGKISIELDRDLETRMQAIYYWRNEILRTGRRPFHDMRAIVVAEKKQPLITVIQAGGGTIVNAEPPFTDTVHATHCLLEAKSIDNFSVYEPLAKQGIYCVNTVYISDFLNRTSNDIKDSILPFFQKYFR